MTQESYKNRMAHTFGMTSTDPTFPDGLCHMSVGLWLHLYPPHLDTWIQAY